MARTRIAFERCPMSNRRELCVKFKEVESEMNSMRPELTDSLLRPEMNDPYLGPGLNDQPLKPEVSDPSVRRKQMYVSARPVQTKQSIRPVKSNIPKSSEDTFASALHKYSDSYAPSTHETRKIHNKTGEFMELLEKHKKALELGKQYMSSELDKKSKSSLVVPKFKSSDLNESKSLKFTRLELKDLHLISGVNDPHLRSEVSDSPLRSEVDDPSVRRKQIYVSTRAVQSKQSARPVKSNSSKSCKDTFSSALDKYTESKMEKSPEAVLISKLLRKLEEIKLPETSATASIQHGKKSLFFEDSNIDIDHYFSLFKDKAGTSPRSSDSGTLTPGSDIAEFGTNSKPSESAKNPPKAFVNSNCGVLSEKSKLLKSSPKSKQLESNLPVLYVRPKLHINSKKKTQNCIVHRIHR